MDSFDPKEIDPFFLSYISRETEEDFYQVRISYTKALINQILIFSNYIIMLIIRILTLITSIVKKDNERIILELIWLVLTIVSTSFDLLLADFFQLYKIKGIPSVIINLYILGHSTYIYFFITDASGQYYFPSYVILTILIILLGGIFQIKNWLIFSLTLFIGEIGIIIFPFCIHPSFNTMSKVMVILGALVFWFSISCIIYSYEKLMKILYLHFIKYKQYFQEMEKLFHTFPNEILIISNDKPLFCNKNFISNFEIITQKNQPKRILSASRIQEWSKQMKFRDKEYSFHNILKEPYPLSYINQEEPMDFNSLNSKQSFSYKCFEMIFKNELSMVYIFSNISAFFQLEKEKKEKTERQIMISQLTHDMRTPLSALICAEEDLESSTLNPAQQETLTLMKNTTQRVLLLVNDSLDLFQNDEIKIRPSCDQFKISSVIKNCYNMMKYSFKAKRIELQCMIDQNVPKYMYSDEQRVQRIIINLLGNALKFTLRGYVKLKVKFNSDSRLLHVSVRDTGQGIPDSELSNLFTRFGVLRDSKGLNRSGLGIGLTVCKTLCQALGGDIDIVSKLGIGTKFFFWLPIEFNQSNLRFETQYTETLSSIAPLLNNEEDNSNRNLVLDNQERSKIEEEKISSFQRQNVIEKDTKTFSLTDRKKVLLVDDDPFVIRSLIPLFTKRNCICDEAHNGEQAIEIISNQLKSKNIDDLYDLIILDYQMNQLNGIETLKQLNSLFRNIPKKPKIAISTGEMNPDIINEIIVNNGLYILKPLNSKKIDELLMNNNLM